MDSEVLLVMQKLHYRMWTSYTANDGIAHDLAVLSHHNFQCMKSVRLWQIISFVLICNQIRSSTWIIPCIDSDAFFSLALLIVWQVLCLWGILQQPWQSTQAVDGTEQDPTSESISVGKHFFMFRKSTDQTAHTLSPPSPISRMFSGFFAKCNPGAATCRVRPSGWRREKLLPSIGRITEHCTHSCFPLLSVCMRAGGIIES